MQSVAILLLCILVLHFITSEGREETSVHIEEALKRSRIHQLYKRDGFREYAVHDPVRRRKRADDNTSGSMDAFLRRHLLEAVSEPFHLNLQFGDLELNLELKHTSSVLHPGIQVVTSVNGTDEPYIGAIPDCFATGPTSDKEGKAVVSFCNGLRGHVTHQNHVYTIEPLHEITRNSEHEGQVLIYRKHLSEQVDNDQTTAGSGMSDLRDHRRYKRQTGRPSSFNIEVGTLLDSYITEILVDERGMNTAEIIEFVAATWAGVQHFWGHDLGYEIAIQLKYIKIYKTDPESYGPADSIGTMLGIYCRHFRDSVGHPRLDHVHIFTGADTEDNAIGRAYVGYACVEGWNCGISYVWTAANFWRPAHEMGHNLGMSHPPNVECDHKEDYGNRYYCGRKMLNIWLQKSTADCMFEENVPLSDVDETLRNRPPFSDSPPGDTLDNFCERSFGESYKYRPYSLPLTHSEVCNKHICVDLNQGPKFGRMERSGYDQRGVACDTGKVCNGDWACVEASTLHHETPPTVIVGGWSDWGPYLECSTTCGTGVTISQRNCDNPTPHNSPPCGGDAFRAELCNTRPCGDDYQSRPGLIKQRADHACEILVSAKVLVPWLFLPTGNPRRTTGLASCEVKCEERQYMKYPYRHGLMPNGSPCETHGHCVNGYCMEFGCDGKTQSATTPPCDNIVPTTEWTSRHTTFHAEQSVKGVRLPIEKLPTTAKDIRIEADYSQMQQVSVELLSKDGVVVISPFTEIATTTTGESPIFLAGTHWTFNFNQQILTAAGPLTEPVGIAVYQNGDIANAAISISYGYSSSVGTCTGICSNGGVWNKDTCGCTCPSGFSGLRCELQCPATHCYNKGTMNRQTCECDCPPTTKLSSNCHVCKSGYTGKDCAVYTGQICAKGQAGLNCDKNCGDTVADCASRVFSGECLSDGGQTKSECPFGCGSCTKSDGSKKLSFPWLVRVFTGMGGTDGDVTLRLVSTSGLRTPAANLDDYKDNFEKNQIDTFTLITHEDMDIASIEVGFTSTDEWFLNKIVIRNEDESKSYTFQFNHWLPRTDKSPVSLRAPSGDYPIEDCHNIYAHCDWYATNGYCTGWEEIRRNCPIECKMCVEAIKWQIEVHTSDFKYAGSNGWVYGIIYGKQTDSATEEIKFGPILLDDEKNNFEMGMVDIFTSENQIRIPTKFALEYRTDDWWHVKKVILRRMDNNAETTFSYNDWLYGLQTVVLTPDV